MASKPGPDSASTARDWRMFGGVQLYRWLNLNGQFFVRRRRVLRSGSNRIRARAATAASASRCSRADGCRRASTTGASSFDRASTGEHVYDLDLIYSRTTYQFSRQFFIRGIVAVRQLALPRAHRLPRVVRASSGHGRLRRVRVAHRAARISSTASGSRARATTSRASAGCSSRRRTCIGFSNAEC